MCLSSVTDRNPNPSEEGVGWKVIVDHHPFFSGPFCGGFYPFGQCSTTQITQVVFISSQTKKTQKSMGVCWKIAARALLW